MWWWAGAAWATCTQGSPCQVEVVDAECRPSSVELQAGEPVYLTAVCVEAVCCAGSAESCSTTYRPFAPRIWRQDGSAWVDTGLAVADAGVCGTTPRHVVRLPGGELRIGELTVSVRGEVPQTPTPWPPGFPPFTDGLHARVPAPDGSAEVAVEDLASALAAAGWSVDPHGTWAARDGVLVRLSGTSLAWRSLDVPADDEPCPEGTASAEPSDGARACVDPSGVLQGPWVQTWSGGSSRGWYADGALDGDWLDVAPGAWAIRAYAAGAPAGHWEAQGPGTALDGAYADGVKDGTWTTTSWEPASGAVIEVVDWCRGARCGRYERTAGATVETGSYADDQKQGEWRTTWNDLVVFEGRFDEGRPVGVHRATQANGRPFSLRSYDGQGRADGVWRDYDSLGNVVVEDVWRAGVLVRHRAWSIDAWGRRVRVPHGRRQGASSGTFGK